MSEISLDELKEIAKDMGYILLKKPIWDCACWGTYPNEKHRNKCGSWKCIDKYEPIPDSQLPRRCEKTYCRRKEREE